LDIELLRAFVVVAETRNFTRAAQRLGRVQSAVSMQIKRLEELLNARLLERSHRSVTLTSQGEVVLRYAHRVMHLTDEALTELGNGARSGRVRFAATDMSIGFLPQVFERFRTAYPLVEIELLCMPSLAALEALEDGRADLAFVTQTCGRKGGKRIARTPLIWVSARSVDLTTIDPLPVALFAPECIYRTAAIEALKKNAIRYRLAYESASRAGLDCVVEAGLAVAVLPEKAISHSLRDVSGKLPALPDLNTYLFARTATKTPAVGALADALIEALG
jgi:DNA-binding transcriptional LysR family regulator